MQIRIFSIPIPGGDRMNEEMNKFLRSNRILQTESQLVNNESGTFWCFCIRYLEDNMPQEKRKKVDYREVLDEASFRRFAQMRQTRKRLAQQEGIPAYAIFTDQEMAGLARLENLTASTMKSVKSGGEEGRKIRSTFHCKGRR